MRRKPTPWTEDDQATARKLYEKLGSYSAVAKVMGRSESTVGERLQGLRGSHRIGRVSQDMAMIPSEVIADRDRRRDLHPRDYTAAFFGDPLPGYSAWDRR